MSKYKVYLSHDNLVKCPCCGTHTEAAEEISQTQCHGCGKTLARALDERGGFVERMVVRGGRSALLAAALFVAVPACSGPQDKPTPTTDTTATTPSNNASTNSDEKPASNNETKEGTNVEVETAPSSPITPKYGLPPGK